MFIQSFRKPLFCFLTLLLLPLQAQDKASQKAKLQVAYVYNILQYTRWPLAKQEGALLMAVKGEGLFARQLKSLDGKLIHGRKLKLVDFNSEHLLDLSVLVLTGKRQCIKSLKGQNLQGVLTICAGPKCDDQGGIVSFVEVNKRLRFKVNLEALKKSGVSLSSRLLQLAIIEKEED